MKQASGTLVITHISSSVSSAASHSPGLCNKVEDSVTNKIAHNFVRVLKISVIRDVMVGACPEAL